MTNVNTEQALVSTQELLARLKQLRGSQGKKDRWRIDADIIRNDAEEFAETTFPKKSPEHTALYKALYPAGYSNFGNAWERFWSDYGSHLERALQVVKHRLQQGQARLLQHAADEHLIEPGTPYSAYILLRQLVESATSSILLADPYVDRTLFPLLSNAGNNVPIRILTRQQNVPADFVTEAAKFMQQTGAQLECRAGIDDLHDRFLVVDDRLFFSGASFKDLGKKGSVVAEIKDIKIQSVAELEKRWKSATVLR